MCDCAKYPNREQNKFTQFHKNLLSFTSFRLSQKGHLASVAAPATPPPTAWPSKADVEAARHALKNGQQCSEKRGRLDLVI